MKRGILLLTAILASVGILGCAGAGAGSGGDSKDDETGGDAALTASKILADDLATQDQFGYSVAVSGSYMIVGAPNDDDNGSDSGSAYVFRRTGPGSWDAGTKILASDGASDDDFGASVDISGDYAIVGAPDTDDDGMNSGSAYIYRRTGDNSWDSGTEIGAPAADANAIDFFGSAVAINSEYAVVGVPNNDANNGAGNAYVFHRTGPNSWDGGTELVPDNGQSGDDFGASVAIDGDYLVVGSPDAEVNLVDTGSAYVFHRTGPNSWDSGTRIFDSAGSSDDKFGISVGVSGDYVVVGARDNDSKADNAGNALVFKRTGANAWDSGTEIVSPDADAAQDFFGEVVDIHDDFVIVGAIGNDENGLGAGSVYVFHRASGNSWDAGTKVVAPDGESMDEFGYAVGIGAEFAAAGARFNDDDGQASGSAYVIELPTNN